MATVHQYAISRFAAGGNGAARVTRTPDLRITNAPLYQLSYGGPRMNRSGF